MRLRRRLVTHMLGALPLTAVKRTVRCADSSLSGERMAVVLSGPGEASFIMMSPGSGREPPQAWRS